MAALSFIGLELLPVNFSYLPFAALLLLNGVGMGLFASYRAGVMNSLPRRQRGAGAGMNATFQNSAMVLSISLFFTLLIVGLSSGLPASLQHGLSAHGVPATQAAKIAHLPPLASLFAAFLGSRTGRRGALQIGGRTMTVVAISASYGAGGTVVGPELATRLGVDFVDRAIPLAVAEELDVPLDDAQAHDEEAQSPSWLDRLLRGFINTDSSVPAPVPSDAFTSEDFRRATEDVLLRQAATGRGVVLGRAAVIVLRERTEVLRVRLDGPRERRVEQAMALGKIDRATAEAALSRIDRTHAEYTRRFYGADITDPRLYHTTIDSTSIAFSTCVEMIAMAAGSLASCD